MHLTRGGGGINQGETAHPLWSLDRTVQEAVLVFKLGSKNEGKEPRGRSFKT